MNLSNYSNLYSGKKDTNNIDIGNNDSDDDDNNDNDNDINVDDDVFDSNYESEFVFDDKKIIDNKTVNQNDKITVIINGELYTIKYGTFIQCQLFAVSFHKETNTVVDLPIFNHKVISVALHIIDNNYTMNYSEINDIGDDVIKFLNEIGYINENKINDVKNICKDKPVHTFDSKTNVATTSTVAHTSTVVHTEPVINLTVNGLLYTVKQSIISDCMLFRVAIEKNESMIFSLPGFCDPVVRATFNFLDDDNYFTNKWPVTIADVELINGVSDFMDEIFYKSEAKYKILIQEKEKMQSHVNTSKNQSESLSEHKKELTPEQIKLLNAKPEKPVYVSYVYPKIINACVDDLSLIITDDRAMCYDKDVLLYSVKHSDYSNDSHNKYSYFMIALAGKLREKFHVNIFGGVDCDGAEFFADYSISFTYVHRSINAKSKNVCFKDLNPKKW